MGLFEEMLKPGETLFKDEIALDYGYLPKLMPFRETEQRKVAFAIKPLLEGRNGKTLFIYGPPGIGKTAAIKHVLRDLENETDEVIPIYINCWKFNSTFQILQEMCHWVDYKFTQNKDKDELLKVVKNVLNKKSAVLVFDEVDKLNDVDFFYMIGEEIRRRTVILITNYKIWLTDLDERIRSRISPELIEFKQYNEKETYEILKQRREYAFMSNIWDEIAFKKIADKTSQLKDIRSGLFLMREAGLAAEERASKKIESRDVDLALKKFDDFSFKDEKELKEDDNAFLDLIKNNSGIKIGELFIKYQEAGGKLSYKSIQRKIKRLHDNGFITAKTINDGKGRTTIVEFSVEKKLTDF
ncbi:MAG: AAA family ATPase [Candidatus Woesearchaeota archaeon]